MKTYSIDIQMYGIEFHNIKAKTKVEAKKKAVEKLKRQLKKHINKIYVDEMD